MAYAFELGPIRPPSEAQSLLIRSLEIAHGINANSVTPIKGSNSLFARLQKSKKTSTR